MNKSLLEIHATTNFSTFVEEARAVIDLTFDQLDVPELKGLTRIELNNRFLRRAADATYSTFKRQGRIRISTKYLTLAGEKDRIQTFVHEAAHVADGYLNPFAKRVLKGHGPTWSRLMAKAGYPNAPVCTQVSLDVFRELWRHNCKCGKVHSLSKNRFTRMFVTNTRRYVCSVCRAPLRIEDMERVN